MWLNDLEKRLKEKGIFYKKEEVLAPYTTIKIGGPCSLMIFPKTKEEILEILEYLEKENIHSFILGGGSNLLVADEGFDGVVLTLKEFKGMEIVKEKEKEVILKIKAGTLVNALISLCLKEGFSGIEFLAGIPATIGGTIKMNAGAFGNTISSFVRTIEIYKNNKLFILKSEENLWDYRVFKEEGAILEVELKLKKMKKERIKEKVKEYIQKRKKNQPFSKKTFGSVFKNPPNDYAGRLIDACGLKGYRIGDAEISEKHANFIVNLGKAKAKEVLKLIKLAQDKVFEKFNIKLEPEVKFLGCSL